MEDCQPTFKDAKSQIEAQGMTLTKTPHQQEFKVDFPAGKPGHVSGDEGSAYFTDVLSDAIGTAKEMRSTQDAREQQASEEAEAAQLSNAVGFDQWGHPTSDPSKVEVPYGEDGYADDGDRMASIAETLAALDYDCSKDTAAKPNKLASMVENTRASVSAHEARPKVEAGRQTLS